MQLATLVPAVPRTPAAALTVEALPTIVQPRITGEEPPTHIAPPPPLPVAVFAVKSESRIAMFDELKTSSAPARAALLPRKVQREKTTFAALAMSKAPPK